ncbi:mannose-1-phosphate guanylyltransferase [Pelotomaculum propionicicum]|uniref:mannose-1-phosphate guanylyltransferase n=1 Tax=Pelotomaculum propionicicum TaxID=258475 RepID=A0A4Y7RMY2_9FIRM|nr:mannose-1-phosphate guanylyltransferase [Pelotomaculum propionicicum]NLI11081.1 NTP transferase domain-containing protein [Peptococcaceae bacterium]TEB10354.1 Mannose-1-phosphate guanylyltransferase 1 [Pelotomaculum propionicicum]
MIENKLCAVIMAGGTGERFWPKSRAARPKQLLCFTGKDSLLRGTINRLQKWIPVENILVVTTEKLAATIELHLPELPRQNMIVEPVGRNTAPCLLLAALHVENKGDPVMVIVPSDHVIQQNDRFVSIMKAASSVAAASDVLVTIGINPTSPETGYGYIMAGQLLTTEGGARIYSVIRFVEKPDRLTAEKYLAEGNYYWNSGMFVWRPSILLSSVQEYLPGITKKLPQMRRAVADNNQELMNACYHDMPNISIDYGVMEKAKNVLVIPGDFGWDDIGSWAAMERIAPADADGNVLVGGECLNINSENCIIEAQSKLVATVGVKNMVIVESEDVILICPKERVQDIKSVVNQLRLTGKEKYI